MAMDHASFLLRFTSNLCRGVVPRAISSHAVLGIFQLEGLANEEPKILIDISEGFTQ